MSLFKPEDFYGAFGITKIDLKNEVHSTTWQTICKRAAAAANLKVNGMLLLTASELARLNEPSNKAEKK